MAISRLGGVRTSSGANDPAAADTRALFLKQFAGEVLTAFEEKNIAMPLHRVRTISNGKSAQFPITGKASASYHTAGSEIVGGAIANNEITVSVDDLLISHAFIPRIDEAMNHYDVRSIYSKELGNALSTEADKNIFKIIASSTGASASSDGTIPAGGGSVNCGANAAGVTGAKVADAVFAGLKKFDETDVIGEKVAVLTPLAYYALFGNAQTVANMAYMNSDVGGSGSVSTGTAPTVGGVKIFMSNHIPTTNEANAGASTTQNPIEGGRAGSYFGANFNNSLTQGIMFTKDAAATVKLLDLGVESEYQIERQGTLMVAKYAMGHNALRPDCSIRIVTTG